MQLLGGDKGEALPQIEPHLMAENRDRARAGPVILAHALAENAAHKLVILLHGPEVNASLAGAEADSSRPRKLWFHPATGSLSRW